jgi:hypothetical protein
MKKTSSKISWHCPFEISQSKYKTLYEEIKKLFQKENPLKLQVRVRIFPLATAISISSMQARLPHTFTLIVKFSDAQDNDIDRFWTSTVNSKF